MNKAFAAVGAAITALVLWTGTAMAAPVPPDVGDTTGPVLDAGLDAVLAGIVDLAPWLIPAGLVVMIARKAIRSFSRGRATSF